MSASTSAMWVLPGRKTTTQSRMSKLALLLVALYSTRKCTVPPGSNEFGPTVTIPWPSFSCFWVVSFLLPGVGAMPLQSSGTGVMALGIGVCPGSAAKDVAPCATGATAAHASMPTPTTVTNTPETRKARRRGFRAEAPGHAITCARSVTDVPPGSDLHRQYANGTDAATGTIWCNRPLGPLVCTPAADGSCRIRVETTTWQPRSATTPSARATS